jgi:hypothetical protein
MYTINTSLSLSQSAWFDYIIKHDIINGYFNGGVRPAVNIVFSTTVMEITTAAAAAAAADDEDHRRR